MKINHILCTSKSFTDLYLVKQKAKIKNAFEKAACSVLVIKMYWQHKKICLKINGGEAVKLKSGFIEYKNYFKQIPVPFKFYADFEYTLNSIKSNESF